MKLQAVAWDIDGTLVDSEPVHLLALKMVCQDYDVSIADLPDDHFVGVHLEGVWQALAPRFGRGLNQPQWVHELNQHYLRLAVQITPMPGALQLVAELSRLGIRQVAVSNSNRAVVDANLAVGGLSEHMAFSISVDDVAAGKPNPEPYAQAARRLGLLPQSILAIEDSVTGLRSAKAAQLRTLGFGIDPALVDVADRVVVRLHGVLDAFDFEVSNGL